MVPIAPLLVLFLSFAYIGVSVYAKTPNIASSLILAIVGIGLAYSWWKLDRSLTGGRKLLLEGHWGGFGGGLGGWYFPQSIYHFTAVLVLSGGLVAFGVISFAKPSMEETAKKDEPTAVNEPDETEVVSLPSVTVVNEFDNLDSIRSDDQSAQILEQVTHEIVERIVARIKVQLDERAVDADLADRITARILRELMTTLGEHRQLIMEHHDLAIRRIDEMSLSIDRKILSLLNSLSLQLSANALPPHLDVVSVGFNHNSGDLTEAGRNLIHRTLNKAKENNADLDKILVFAYADRTPIDSDESEEINFKIAKARGEEIRQEIKYQLRSLGILEPSIELVPFGEKMQRLDTGIEEKEPYNRYGDILFLFKGKHLVSVLNYAGKEEKP